MKSTKLFRLMGLIVFFSLFPLWAFSQNVTVKGIVKDVRGNRLSEPVFLKKVRLMVR